MLVTKWHYAWLDYMGFAYGIYNWGVSLGKISIQKERQRPYYGLERVETTRRGQGQTMKDKEKLRMAKNLVKSNNKKIKKALKAIDDFEKSDPAVQAVVVHGLDHITRDLGRCLQTIKKIKEVLEK